VTCDCARACLTIGWRRVIADPAATSFAACPGMVTISAIPLVVVLLTIGYPIGSAEAAILTVLEVLAAAIGIVLGRIGFREFLAGGLAAAVELPGSMRNIPVMTDHAIECLTLLPIGLLVLLLFSAIPGGGLQAIAGGMGQERNPEYVASDTPLALQRPQSSTSASPQTCNAR
jgi:hypothetical protein